MGNICSDNCLKFGLRDLLGLRLVAKPRNKKGIPLISESILFATILVFWKRFNTLQGFSICGPSVASVSRFRLEVSNQSFWSNTRYWKLDKFPNPTKNVVKYVRMIFGGCSVIINFSCRSWEIHI